MKTNCGASLMSWQCWHRVLAFDAKAHSGLASRGSLKHPISEAKAPLHCHDDPPNTKSAFGFPRDILFSICDSGFDRLLK